MGSSKLCFQLLCSFLIGATPSIVSGQFSDDFSDGDFTANPVWTGDDLLFQVNPDNELQLNATSAGTAQLQSDNIMNSLDDQEWRFWIKQSFSPSGSNFGRVYLVSDQVDLNGPLNGYFIQFGEAGSNDAIELFEQSGTTENSVARGTDGLVSSSFELGIRVTRTTGGNWTISADPTGGTNYTFQAAGVNATHGSSAHIGVRCTYTVSNASNFYFDGFYAGPLVVDVDPPVISNVIIVDADHIDVQFDEAVEQLTAEDENNYDIQPFLSATLAERNAADFSVVSLTLISPLTNGNSYNLIVSGVEDLSGNAMPSTPFMFDYIVPDTAELREVVINEIMADPSPPVALPDAEFVELYNTTTNQTFDLNGWELSDATTTATIPPFQLPPGGYVLLVDAGQIGLFSGFNNVIGLNPWPSLNNSGDDISIRNVQGVLIDQISYEDSWYNDGIKDDGGWTLEQINPITPCSGAANWTASNALSGGTPESSNSVFSNAPDTVAPYVVGINVNGSSSITIEFSEDLDQLSITTATYQITPSISVQFASLNGTRSVELTLTSAMSPQTIYNLTVSGITDCAGNIIGVPNSGEFGLPEPVNVGDIVINEVLYDPIGGGSDYIELYNNSNKIIDLSTLFLANEVAGQIDNITQITNSGSILLPRDYVLLTSDGNFVKSEYPDAVESTFLITSLPSYNNGEGTVALLDVTSDEIDIFRYDDDLHFALLTNTEGVSLERVNPERPSSDDSNWHSAAETVGWGTPGYLNSQFAETPAASGEVSIDPAIFSPDNDGYQDLLTIRYQFNNAGVVGTARVYDLAGRPIRTLLENELLATNGALSWDGIMDDNTKARIGAYVVLFEAFDLSGETMIFQETVTLAHPLD
jgi:hypothetical protein